MRRPALGLLADPVPWLVAVALAIPALASALDRLRAFIFPGGSP